MRKLLSILTIGAMVLLSASCKDDEPGGTGGGDPAGPECVGTGQSTCASGFECVSGACVAIQTAIQVCEPCTASSECEATHPVCRVQVTPASRACDGGCLPGGGPQEHLAQTLRHQVLLPFT